MRGLSESTRLLAFLRHDLSLHPPLQSDLQRMLYPWIRHQAGTQCDLVKRVFGEYQDMGIHFITVLGGKPFVYPHLFTLIEEHPNIFFQVYTNGTLMTREKAKRFSDVGNVLVVMSIEGYEEETDRWRGKGVYRKIMNSFDYLLREHVLIGSSATVTSENAHLVPWEEFIDCMIEKGSFAQMYFLSIPVNGHADFSLMATPEIEGLPSSAIAALSRWETLFHPPRRPVEIYTTRNSDMDNYAERFGEFAAKIWRHDYRLRGHARHFKNPSSSRAEGRANACT